LEFKMHPHGTSLEQDFDLTVHLELEPEKVEGAEEDEEQDE
jgi:hypothetical protein